MVKTLLCERDTTADSASSDEDDLEEVMLVLTEKPKRILRPRLNLDDLTILWSVSNYSGIATNTYSH